MVVGADFLGEELSLFLGLSDAFGEQPVLLVEHGEAFGNGGVALGAQAGVSFDGAQGHAGGEQALYERDPFEVVAGVAAVAFRVAVRVEDAAPFVVSERGDGQSGEPGDVADAQRRRVALLLCLVVWACRRFALNHGS